MNISGFRILMAGNDDTRVETFGPSGSPSNSDLVSFFCDATTGCAAVVIGQLYYRWDVIQRLGLPKCLQAASDAEFALAVFERFDARGLAMLEGEFALAIVDRPRNQLLAVRDPMGSWPLFFRSVAGQTQLGTNVTAMAQRLPCANVNERFLGTFLMDNNSHVEQSSEDTAIDSIRRLMPGTVTAIGADGVENRLARFDWESRIPDYSKLNLGDAAECLEELLRSAVVERVRRGGIAVQLSGGMDSSSVMCVARDWMARAGDQRRLTTLSTVYQQHRLAGETKYIDMLTQDSPQVDPVYLPGDDVVDYEVYRKGVPAHDEPYTWLARIDMVRPLVEAARQRGVTTILTGLGAELSLERTGVHISDMVRRFHFRAALVESRRWAAAHHAPLRTVLARSFSDAFRPSWLRGGIGPLMRGGYGTWPHVGLSTVPPWVHHAFARKHQLWRIGRTTCCPKNRESLERTQRLAAIRSWTGDWATWNLAAPYGIRHSHPFYDPRMILFGLALPTQLRETPGVKQQVLQEAMKGVLPEAIRTRQHKCHYNYVSHRGLNRNLSAIEEMIRTAKINELGLFQGDVLTNAVRQHAMGLGDADSGRRIDASLALIAWYEQFHANLADAARPTEVHRINDVSRQNAASSAMVRIS